MSKSNAATAMEPLRFRFTHEQDVKEYGSDWHTYSEIAIMDLPAKELIELEVSIGTTLVDVMNGLRQSSAFGEMTASWIALKLEGSSVLYDEYSPMIKYIEWEPVPKEEVPDREESRSKKTSEKTGTVVSLDTPPLA